MSNLSGWHRRDCSRPVLESFSLSTLVSVISSCNLPLSCPSGITETSPPVLVSAGTSENFTCRPPPTMKLKFLLLEALSPWEALILSPCSLGLSSLFFLCNSTFTRVRKAMIYKMSFIFPCSVVLIWHFPLFYNRVLRSCFSIRIFWLILRDLEHLYLFKESESVNLEWPQFCTWHKKSFFTSTFFIQSCLDDFFW